MKICSMYKGQLACEYNPQLEPHYALQVLNKWIARFPGLETRLREVGYTKSQKMLTPVQVGMIIDALGEP